MTSGIKGRPQTVSRRLKAVKETLKRNKLKSGGKAPLDVRCGTPILHEQKQIGADLNLLTTASMGPTSVTPPEALISLAPLGIHLMGEGLLPVLLLRGRSQDSGGEWSLPVPLSPLEAGLTLGQSQPQMDLTSPHSGTQLIFESMKLKITGAVFEEIRQQKQWIRLHLKQHPTLQSLLVPAAGVLSLCLHLKVPLYASREFILRSRSLSSELQGIAEGLKRNAVSLKKNHPYLQ